MEKFVAEKPDLTLELTTLEGEEITLEPVEIMSGKAALEITDQWSKLEKENKENKENEKYKSPFEILALELSHVYPKNAEWFLDNFDLGVLNKILIYVAQTIGGLKKKSNSEAEQ